MISALGIRWKFFPTPSAAVGAAPVLVWPKCWPTEAQILQLFAESADTWIRPFRAGG